LSAKGLPREGPPPDGAWGLAEGGLIPGGARHASRQEVENICRSRLWAQGICPHGACPECTAQPSKPSSDMRSGPQLPRWEAR